MLSRDRAGRVGDGLACARCARRGRRACARPAAVAAARAGRRQPVGRPSSRRMKPFSAPVSSMTSSSIASSSSSTFFGRHELLAELEELAQPAERRWTRLVPRARCSVSTLGRRRRPRWRRGSSNMENASSASPSVQPVAVDEARAALLLAVDEDLGVCVDLFEVEVAAVEEDLRVVSAIAWPRDRRRRCRAPGRSSRPACRAGRRGEPLRAGTT